MESVKYLIIGAGPAGLTFARRLLDHGETSFIVLEKEEEAGGLCRSVMVDSAPLDIGGGHFLDVRRPAVTAFLFRFMPEDEWAYFERDSRIAFRGKTIGHPFEANLWQLDADSQVEYLLSVARAGCNTGEAEPEKFVDWIRWKLGDRIAEDYMLPYNRKMFADDLNELGTYWLDKLPNVSFEETLRSCLTRRPYGTQPGHAAFYYPKEYGYGEVWLRIAASMEDYIRYRQNVCQLDAERRIIETEDGGRYQATHIITTIPWDCYNSIAGMPEELRAGIAHLKHTAVEIRYVPEHLDTAAHWIYIPDENLPCHRILVRHNFAAGSKGYWMETRQENTGGLKGDNFRYLNRYAYPLNTVDKPAVMRMLMAYMRERGIYGLGRWGEHEHYNSDLVVELAMRLEEELTGK